MEPPELYVFFCLEKIVGVGRERKRKKKNQHSLVIQRDAMHGPCAHGDLEFSWAETVLPAVVSGDGDRHLFSSKIILLIGEKTAF